MSNKKRSTRKSGKTVGLEEIQAVTEKKDNSPYVPQRDKINFNINIRELPWTEKQKQAIELITSKDTKIVFLSGPAGTSKTLLATYCGLKLLNEKKVSEIIYVRSIIESASKSLGALPGFCEDKFKPFALPLTDKAEELIKTSDIKKLLIEDRIKPIPVNFLRGASFNVNYIIADEMQNAEHFELQTIISRIGQFSKFIICGDPMQCDIKEKNKSGFKPMFDLFNDEESKAHGIHCIEFGKEDIVRSEILKYIVAKLESLKNNK
jgi:phosphate starvation-inducible protein PhoH and related proteins